ncbi:MAG: hypothetical protein RLZZ312_96 [Bacteroidota bacterium]
MKRFFFLFILNLFCGNLFSQEIVFGDVFYEKTKKPIAFVSVCFDNQKKIISESNGKFEVETSGDWKFFDVSYVGFKKVRIYKSSKKHYTVFLLENVSQNAIKKDINAAQALQTIQKTISKKTQNWLLNYRKNFSYIAYNKLIVSANPDSIMAKIDTVFDYKKGLAVVKKIDSSSYNFKKIVAKQHLFETEKISFFQYQNNNLKETVLGSKMAGFKQPIYEVLGFSLQSFSIYDNEYQLLNARYKSPVHDRYYKNFDFKILDTIAINGRNAQVIFFKSKKQNISFDGVVYIDLDSYAIAKATMHTKGILELIANHDFVYLDNEKLWFPIQNSFKLSKGISNKDISMLGGTIKFDSDLNDKLQKRKKEPSDFVYLLSESANDKIVFDDDKPIRNPAIAIDVNDDANAKPERFWTAFRKKDLDSRSKQTYLFLDSISVKRRFENKVIFGRKIIHGFVPVGAVDIDLRKSFNFNNYEGFRFCAAATTNDLLSKKLRLAGYLAYGTKDGRLKYNLGTSARLGRRSTSWIGFSYTDDIQEIASTTFSVENRQFKLFDTSLFNLSSFYNYVSWKAYLETKIVPKTESVLEISHNIIDPKFAYKFFANEKIYQSFNLTTAQLSLQWNPFSEYMQTPNGLLENVKKFPKFTIQINKSITNTFANDFNFTKLDFKTEFETKYIDGQLTNIIFSTGYALGDVPITHLYNNSPNSLNANSLLGRIALDGENDFETMYFNEFFSNQYAFFQFKHEFKSFEISNDIKPNFVLVFRTAFGNLTNPEQHQDIVYKTLTNGYLESGIQLNKIYKGVGLGCFYRFGANHLATFNDNFAIRFSYKLDVGF